MDKELNCDFYFSDKAKSANLKKMDYSKLNNFKKELKYYKIIGDFSWMKGALSLAFKPYKVYFLVGEPYCVSTWLFLLIAKILNKKTYLWSHGWYGRERFFKRLIKKTFFNLSNKVFLYGNYAKKLMIENGVSSNKLEVVYNSLDYSTQLEIRNGLTTSNIYNHYFKNDYPVLIYIGRIQKVKRLDLLIDAMVVLKNKGINTNLMLIGAFDNNEEEFFALINKNKLRNNVWTYGACYDEQKIGEFIFNANVCVSPGNVGLTAMHALVYGTPVITHDNFKNQMPEFEAIVPDLTGGFFFENDYVDLAVKIKSFLNLSPEKREFVRQKSYQKIDLFYNPYSQLEIFKKSISF